jgi:hypothetical protein
MKVPKLLLMAALLTSCASRAPVAAPLPELFNHDYEFFGTIEGHSVSGTIRFENQGVHPVEYMIVSESGLCRNQLHRVRTRVSTSAAAGWSWSSCALARS